MFCPSRASLCLGQGLLTCETNTNVLLLGPSLISNSILYHLHYTNSDLILCHPVVLHFFCLSKYWILFLDFKLLEEEPVIIFLYILCVLQRIQKADRNTLIDCQGMWLGREFPHSFNKYFLNVPLGRILKKIQSILCLQIRTDFCCKVRNLGFRAPQLFSFPFPTCYFENFQIYRKIEKLTQ